MIENEWWSRYIKPRWHNVEKGFVARKVQDVTNKGAPDVDACWNGIVVKVELKYTNKLPARLNTKLTFSRYSKDEPNRRTVLTREQCRNLEEWHKAKGLAYVLIGVSKAWYLIPAFRIIQGTFNDGVTTADLELLAEIWDEDIKKIGCITTYPFQ